MQIAGQSALITGAARGIGRATALDLAKAGADIIGTDVDADGLAETGCQVQSLGRSFLSFVGDISTRKTVQGLVEVAAQSERGFAILINNAGVAPCGAFTGRSFEEWTKAININLLSLMHLTWLALPHLATYPQAHIVNIASVAGKFGGEGLTAYAASKHGVVGFSSSLREELADRRIGVSWICPSYVNTRIVEGIKRSFITPIVEVEQVAHAIRKAILKNQAEIFVPRFMRLPVDILPAIFPNFSRKISKYTKAAQGWLHAEKRLNY
ncbi:MAG: SDR family NAD(P)-dependent oxidoreductase [Deferribacteres bacterium]|nr:SDR family NAD(P)-dependent oxidoreductase [candidate division KSB1 bacterium]MCB9510551.1 SDR family NAD(P)-dependent oxidoreductase [Deferribacteres bacterium]